MAASWRHLAICVLALALPAAAQLLTPEAVPMPDGDTSFVGKVTVSFPQIATGGNGRIYYTLNVSSPAPSQANGTEYEGPFDITATTTLRSVRVRNSLRSVVHTAQFTRRKLPLPAILFEDRAEFVGTKRVTLSVSVSVPPSAPNYAVAPRIMYSTDASDPDSLYTSPLTLAKTCRLKVWATHPDYDNSPMASQDFKLLVPVETPVLTPRGRIFQEWTLPVAFTSGTPDAYFQYAIGADANPDTGSIGASVILEGRTPGETITLRVVAKKTGMAPAYATEVYTYQPRPAMPSAHPLPTFFQDTLTLTLSGLPDIHYTLDNSPPTGSKTRYEKPFRIDSTVTLKAAVINAQGTSDTYTGTYALNLSAPTPSRPPGEFMDTAQVVLKARNPGARILYELEGKDPTLSSPAYNPADGPIVLSMDTELRTMAVKGSVTSPIVSYAYTKTVVIRTTPTPEIDPPGRNFPDSLHVRIYGADVQTALEFSRDGGPWLPYVEPIPVYASTTLRARAQQPFLQLSAIRTEKYTLIPAKPIASPSPDQPYPDKVAVTLSTPSADAKIFCYHHENDEPFIRSLATLCPATLYFEKSRWLWAVAEAGAGEFLRTSELLKVRYTVYASNPTDTLGIGKEREIAPDILLINRGTGSIIAKLGSFDLLDLRGFADPSHTVAISAGTTQAVPRLEFTRPEGKRHAIYRVVNGGAEFVGSGPVVAADRAGTYFAAVDTMPPSFHLVEHSAGSGEGTSIKLRVVDNVAGVPCEVEGSGLGSTPLRLRADAEGLLGFTLKGSPGELKNLWFLARAYDGANPGAFPAGGGRYHPPQSWPKLVTPAVWNLGGDKPYDMAGLPIGAGSALTWAQIKKDNPGMGLAAFVYRDGDHIALKDAETLEPGRGIWLGAGTPGTSLILSKFESAPSDPDGGYRVALRPGWNLISNPSLEKLYWPAARSNAAKYEAGQLKGLWGYPPGVKQYAESDSLEPWVGYWVYLWGVRDTVVEMLAAPAPAAKRATSWDPSTVEIRLDYGRPSPIRLGARAYARDGLGMEDEPMLPGWNPTRQAWAIRGRDRLMTDLVQFSPDQVLEWKVVLEGRAEIGVDSMVTVTEVRLPAGFAAWAYSARRNLKVSLETGAGYSLPGGDADTLLILAGPAVKLAARPELARAVTGVAAFASSLRRGPQGLSLYLALPSDAQVNAEIRSLSGRLLHTLPGGRLGMGEHHLPVPDSRSLPEKGYLRVRVIGESWRTTKVHPLR